MLLPGPRTRVGQPMRPGIIIAIVVAAAVVIGGVFWFNAQSEQVRLQEQRTEQAAQVEREQQVTREDQAADQAARGVEEADVLPAEGTAVETDEAGANDNDRTVIGDEITEGAIVVKSDGGDPTILDLNDTATSTRNVDDAQTASSSGTLDMTADAEVRDTATVSVGANMTEPAQFLTPANFDRDEVLTLIDDTERLTDEQRSTLRALVEGASANPEMVESAVTSIRAALDLPPLN